jgi:hypothetical protein
VLVALYGPAITGAARTAASPLAPAPAVLSVAGGTATHNARCVQMKPSPGAAGNVIVALPAGGLLLRDTGGVGGSIFFRRFGANFVPFPENLAPHSSRAIVMPADSAGVPWQMQLTSSSTTQICGLRP